ncbi:LytTR family DNA-binding domain-containing protein [Tenacibaculum sp. 190524A02b]|uniref:LytR/AlgR family response regulator transcription factor n=1 Tax=Tenacibaculum vairaonense TaxID=3137860 RepID=UPI0031FB8941
MRYSIVDDEHIAHDIIKGYCEVLPNFQFVKSCYDAIEALTFLKANHVDIVFLDLNMPKLKGFEFLRTLNNPPNVIVTTAYKEFALEGYELNIVDYLLKPFSLERFLKAINKIEKPIQKKQIHLKEEKLEETIFLKSNGKHIQIKTSEILFIESVGNYCKVNTESQTIVIREKLSDFNKMLSNTLFLQVHKSFIIAKKHIEAIEGNRVHIREHIIPVGRTYKINIQKILEN